MRFGNADVAVGERRTANSGERLAPHHQPVPNAQAIADGEKSLPLAFFGPLSIADVNCSRVVLAHRQRGADTRVPATTQENDRALCAFHQLYALHHKLDVISNRSAVRGDAK
jgi:hypothetical protein